MLLLLKECRLQILHSVFRIVSLDCLLFWKAILQSEILLDLPPLDWNQDHREAPLAYSPIHD